MALNREKLKTSIKELMTSMYNQTDKDEATQKYSDELSQAIEDYVKEAEVIYNTGSLMATSAGVVNGQLIAKLS